MHETSTEVNLQVTRQQDLFHCSNSDHKSMHLHISCMRNQVNCIVTTLYIMPACMQSVMFWAVLFAAGALRRSLLAKASLDEMRFSIPYVTSPCTCVMRMAPGIATTLAIILY